MILQLYALLCISSSVTSGNNVKKINFGVHDYHRRFGIPMTNNIKDYEDQLLKKHDLDTYSYRIVGGPTSSVVKVPYQVGLLINVTSEEKNSLSHCGGSLISRRKVLTAGHCSDDGVTNAQHFTVVLGSDFLFHGGLRLYTEDVVVHPGFNRSHVSNDIAVIRIPSVCFNDVILPIALPNFEEATETFLGFLSVASGYGSAEKDKQLSLKSVKVPVITNSYCQEIYGSEWITKDNICTSGKDGKGTCNGDSGGPLAVDFNNKTILIGVVSFGSASACEVGLPYAFTRVSSHITWINSVNENCRNLKKKRI